MPGTQRRAVVIGSGPNGLAAAIALAQAGLQVDVYEAEPEPGGGARTLPLTLPGFLHDFGSAVHPMAVASPFFSSLPLRDYGLEWIQPSAPVAHPLDDGTAVVLERDLNAAEAAFGEDGKQWRRLFGPFAEHWTELAPEILRPVSLFPRHPFLTGSPGVAGIPLGQRHWHATGFATPGPRRSSLDWRRIPFSRWTSRSPRPSPSSLPPRPTLWDGRFPAAAPSLSPRALCGYLASLGGTVHVSTRG